MEKYDYLIAGQGLAGTLLGYFLEKAGKRVFFVDKGHEGSASKAAAGILNPVTGRKFVKSWMVDQLFPFAERTYAEMTESTGVVFRHETNILREYSTPTQENNYMERSSYPEYAKYIVEPVDRGNYKGVLKQDRGTFEFKCAGRVDLNLVVTTFRDIWIKKDCLKAEPFEFDKLKILNRGIEYKNILADQVVFCLGAGAIGAPYFDYLKYEGAKGEIIKVKIPDADFRKIYKHGIFIVPLGEDRYWIGTTNQRYVHDTDTTEENKNFLINKLSSILSLPFEVEEHLAAVRPTVRDRRPLLGIHPDYQSLAIFNGLGTKGASLGPYFAKQMSELLLEDKPVSDAVSIERYPK